MANNKRNNKGQWIGKPIGSIINRKCDKVYRNFIKIKEGKGDGLQNYRLYARWLMEQKFGRELNTDESVHHINDSSTDDRIENLELMTRAEHLSIHKKGVLPIEAIKAASLVYKKRRDKIRKEVVELKKLGMSLRKIALKLKKDRQTIVRILEEEKYEKEILF